MKFKVSVKNTFLPFSIMALMLLPGCPQKSDKISLPEESKQNELAPVATVVAANENLDSDKVDVNKSAPAVVSNGNADIKKAVPVSLAANVDEVSRVSGTVVASRQGTASFKVAGHIIKSYLEMGERVKRGQIMAQLDDKDFELRRKMAQNSFEQSRIALDQARKDLTREEQLKRENVTTASALESRSNALANAEIAQTQAALNLQQIQNSIADTKLAAPYDGVISRRLKVEGDYVGVGAAVYEILSTANTEISLRVPENFFNKIKFGQMLKLSLPSSNQTGRMRVTRVVPFIQENSRTFEVLGQPEGLGETLVPGQFVEAQL